MAKLSTIIRDLQSMQRIIGYDANVVLFANGYKKLKVELGHIQVPGRFESYVMICGDGEVFPNAMDCIDKEEE